MTIETYVQPLLIFYYLLQRQRKYIISENSNCLAITVLELKRWGFILPFRYGTLIFSWNKLSTIIKIIYKIVRRDIIVRGLHSRHAPLPIVWLSITQTRLGEHRFPPRLTQEQKRHLKYFSHLIYLQYPQLNLTKF